MKLYKFRQVDTFSLSGLSNNTLWFSDLNDFNDPFERSYILDEVLSDEVKKELILRVTPKPDNEVDLKIKQKVFKQAGVKSGDNKEEFLHKMLKHDFKVALIDIIHKSKAICMSQESSVNDPLYENLMWSHYADGLRGFCMVFERDKLLQDFIDQQLTIRPIIVEYSDVPVTLSLNEFALSEHVLNKVLMKELISNVTKTLATKSLSWKYENELRMLSLEDNNIHEYYPESLLEIIIGEKMPQDQQKLVIDTARSANPNIIIKYAQLKKRTYQLEIVDYQLDSVA